MTIKHALIIASLAIPLSAFADSQNGQGAGQANGCGQGNGNTQSANCGTPTTPNTPSVGGNASATGGTAQAGAVAGAIAGAQSSAGSQSDSTSSAHLSANTSLIVSSPVSVSSSYSMTSAPSPAQVSIRTVPDIAIGGPASGPCTGASGGGSASWLGGGFGFNSAQIDVDCTRRENARVIAMVLPALAGADAVEARTLLMTLIRGMRPVISAQPVKEMP